MFEEFFSRAVTAGLITEAQKAALLDFAKHQPVTSFVARREPVTPAETITPAPVVIPAKTQPCHRAATDWVGITLLVLVVSLFTGWAVSYDNGPVGDTLRGGLDALQTALGGSVQPADVGPDMAPAVDGPAAVSTY